MKENEKFGFYGRLSENFPSQVIIDITEKCNLACIHCPHNEFQKSNYYQGRELEVDLNTKLVDEVREFGQGQTRYIRFSSAGEPLLHPNAYEMIAYAVKASGVFVTLTTNGTLLNSKIAERLFESGIHMIDISIDAFKPETYAKVRRNGNLSIVSKNVKRLIDISNGQMKVVVSFINQPENHREQKDFISYWENAGADRVVIRPLHSATGLISDTAEKMRKLQENVPRHPCLYPWERVVLTPRGDIAYCPADWTHQTSFMDYRTTTIKEVWQGSFYAKLRQAHLNNDYSDYIACENCPDWQLVSWPDDGYSYAEMVEDLKGEN